MIISELIYNLSLLVALCVFSGFLEDRFDHRTLRGKWLQGMLFGLIAVVAMMYPYHFAEGIQFDGRTIVVSLGTFFFGPLAGAVSTVMAVVYRLWLGGGGMVGGVITVGFSFLIGWLFYNLYKRPGFPKPGKRKLLVFGFLVHVMMLVSMAALPGELIQEAYRRVSLTIILIYPMTTMLIGKILLDQLERREHLEQLTDSEAKFRQLIASSDDIIFTMDKQMRHTGVYGCWLEKLGYKADDIIGRTATEIFGREEGNYQESYYQKALAGETVAYEWNAEGPDGPLYFQTKVSPIHNGKGEIIGMVGIARLINELKQAQKQLSKSLREKDVLLSEIHHRVKNNMAIISSLLTLQSRRKLDPASRKLLVDTENRVHSMALLHEMVYERKNFSEIDMSELLQRLASLLSDSFNMEDHSIAIKIEAESITLDMGTSIPFSLLVNELVTNAYKHAFVENDGGQIEIRFHESNDEYELVVSDDGIGVEDVDELRYPESFGYTIIHGLVRQIRGDIRIENPGTGLRVKIRF